MGLDDKTINDDEDAVMELRMMHKVHRLHTFDLVTPAMNAYEALEIATLNGAKATGFADEVGALVPGMKGDAILVDLGRVARDPWIVSTKYRCHRVCHLEMSPWLGSGAGRARSPSVAQRPIGARLSGARNRTTYLPSERQLARLVEQLSRL
jgi:hypothetical protein